MTGTVPAQPSLPALPRSFFDRPVLELAPDLLGCVLVGRGIRLRITEVEAYAGSRDPGSHAFRGRTTRNRTMFGPAGHLYVYRHMGLHVCMNIVAGGAGGAGGESGEDGTGCLLRAGEIVGGLDLARARRNAAGVTRTDADLARGPGRSTVACAVTWADDGLDLCEPGSAFHLEAPDAAPSVASRPVATGPRIGLRELASDPALYPWRYRIPGDPTVSGPARMNRAPGAPTS